MSVAAFLRPEAIALRLPARTSDEVIRILGGKLNDLGYVKNGFVDAALQREATMPTGLPLGGSVNAAIPHVDIEWVNRPALALATLAQPVVFRNMVDSDEEVPVQLVIVLALDQPKSQIEMLQEICRVLQRPTLIDQLMEASTPEAVLALLSEIPTSEHVEP